MLVHINIYLCLRRVTVGRIGGPKLPPTNYFAVFDGHGGSQAASYAAESLHRNLASSSEYSRGLEGLEEALKEAFETTDQDFLNQPGAQSGTCATVACVAESTLVVANAGDCRGVLCSGPSRKATRLSQDHKPNRADEKARIHAAGGEVQFVGCWRVTARHQPVLLAVSRALGDGHFKKQLPHIVTAEPDCTRTEISLGVDHFFILACDGVWDVFSDQEAVGVVQESLDRYVDRSGRPKGDLANTLPSNLSDIAAQDLDTKALDKGSCDNISAIVVRILPPKLKGPTGKKGGSSTPKGE